MNSLITIQELVNCFKISRTTIDRWRREGMPFEKIGRGVRFNKEDVLEWIRKNKSSEK